MTYLTANADADLDRFHADMVNAGMHDMLDDLHAADSDYTPVPRDYWNMSYGEVCAEIDEYNRECDLEALSRYWNSRN